MTAKKKILIVDDEVELAEIVALEMQDEGFDTQIVNSGYEAMELLKENHSEFNLIISDVRMPNGTGLELLDFVQKNIMPKLPVILVTGFGDIDEAGAIQKGAIAMLGKPIDYSSLIAKAKKLRDN